MRDDKLCVVLAYWKSSGGRGGAFDASQGLKYGWHIVISECRGCGWGCDVYVRVYRLFVECLVSFP